MGYPKPCGLHEALCDTRSPHLQALLVYSIVKYQPSVYGSYRFPAWAELLGILMGLLSCLMIPAGMLAAVLREEGSLWEVSLPHPARPQPHGPALHPTSRAHNLCSNTFFRACRVLLTGKSIFS